MVDNSTNSNKTNNHLSPQTTEHKNTTAYGVGNLGLGLGQIQKYGRVKPFNGIRTLPLF
jgi:hypothetical protein